MSDTERIMMLLEIAGAGGLAPSVIGDICGLGSHVVEPILLHLVEHRHAVRFREDDWSTRRHRYRLTDVAEREEPRRVPLPIRSVPAWMVRS